MSCKNLNAEDAQIKFVCPNCFMVSFNPHDAAERFCGKCGFVDDLKISNLKPPIFLTLSSQTIENLVSLRIRAEESQFDITQIAAAMQNAQSSLQHREKINTLSLAIPGPYIFFVTYTVEKNHPVGTCRHMSMSLMVRESVPTIAQIWAVALILGFNGDLCSCEKIWFEDLSDGGRAINLVQKFGASENGG